MVWEILIPAYMSGVPHGNPIPDDRILMTESARYGYEKKAVEKDSRKIIVS